MIKKSKLKNIFTKSTLTLALFGFLVCVSHISQLDSHLNKNLASETQENRSLDGVKCIDEESYTFASKNDSDPDCLKFLGYSPDIFTLNESNFLSDYIFSSDTLIKDKVALYLINNTLLI